MGSNPTPAAPRAETRFARRHEELASRPELSDIHPNRMKFGVTSSARMARQAHLLGGRAVQDTPRKTIDEARHHIDRADERVRASLERVESTKSRVVASLVRVAQSSSSTFRDYR